jgi:hypothetical protein
MLRFVRDALSHFHPFWVYRGVLVLWWRTADVIRLVDFGYPV